MPKRAPGPPAPETDPEEAPAPPEMRVEVGPAGRPANDASLEDGVAGLAPFAVASAGASCPFLVADDGEWRSGTPSPDHRCAALAPPTAPSRQKQARLCLVSDHVTCATFVAATEARAGRLGASRPAVATGRWGYARTAATIEPISGFGVTLGGAFASRRNRQWILAIILLVALGGIVSRFGGAGSGAIVTESPSPRPTEAILETASAAPAPTEIVVTPEPTAVPTPEPTAGPTPVASHQSYTVRSGDTLSGLAGRFGTTVKAIMSLNNLTSTTLHVGQVLLIP
jgi:LysM repeat protein